MFETGNTTTSQMSQRELVLRFLTRTSTELAQMRACLPDTRLPIEPLALSHLERMAGKISSAAEAFGFPEIGVIAGAIELESGLFNIEEHAYVLWDLVVFEPWFVVEGILLGILGWHYLDRPHNRQIWLILCTMGVIAGIISGLFGVRFA